MCAIAGVYHESLNQEAILTGMRRMCQAMAHRGPDGEGFYVDSAQGVGLGHRRLSIIDLVGGVQPMGLPDGSVVVTFNGEIYNYRELRAELQSAGCVFRTHSDTEVILWAYQEWGTDCFQRLNGMFALGLWDQRRKRLVLARDAAGIKPIYYRRIGSAGLVFASDARGLIAWDDRRPSLNPTGLYSFVRLGYVPSPLSIFTGVEKLAPGALLVAEPWGITVTRWASPAPKPLDPPPSLPQAAEHLLHLYRRAVKRTLVSDVPVGALLSGGIDSGLMLALMNQVGGSWKTFTAGCGPQYADDELADARELSLALGSLHGQIHIPLDQYEERLSEACGFLDEPIGSASIVLMYAVSQRAREEVKAVVMGQGPDELFAGYRRHVGIYYGSYWRALLIKLAAGANGNSWPPPSLGCLPTQQRVGSLRSMKLRLENLPPSLAGDREILT